MQRTNVIMHVDRMLKDPRVVGSGRHSAFRSLGASPNRCLEMSIERVFRGASVGYLQTAAPVEVGVDAATRKNRRFQRRVSGTVRLFEGSASRSCLISILETPWDGGAQPQPGCLRCREVAHWFDREKKSTSAQTRCNHLHEMGESSTRGNVFRCNSC
jgi:hypothetical protein